MKDYNFVYNYGFLVDWFDANPSIKRYEVLKNLGMTDYRTLQNWIEGLTMMPLTQMMKFCNLYNVPITSFFFSEGADDQSVFAPITANAKIEPLGGWKSNEKRAGIKMGDPRCEEHISSNLPSYIRSVTTLSAINNEHSEKTLEEDERIRYLTIIENLSNHIVELSRNKTRSKKINIV